MTDSGAFLVKNSLMAASEALVRMPLLAVILSFLGGLANASVGGRSRNTLSTLALLIPVVFLTGATALWYAASVQRDARPPFVMTGLLLAGIAVIFIHPIWSAMRGEGQA